jgi:HSP20 family protein
MLISIKDVGAAGCFYETCDKGRNFIFRRRRVMAEAATKLPVKNEAEKTDRPTPWRPFENLRREVDRLFDDFQLGGSLRSPFGRSVFDVEPFWRGEISWAKAPAVDVVDKDTAYEITAELPGLEEKNIDVKFADGVLSIKGEKSEEKEDKGKDRYLSERRYGSFQRAFRLPDGVDADKIAASFKNGVLTVTVPKTPEAARSEKKIPITKA